MLIRVRIRCDLPPKKESRDLMCWKRDFLAQISLGNLAKFYLLPIGFSRLSSERLWMKWRRSRFQRRPRRSKSFWELVSTTCLGPQSVMGRETEMAKSIQPVREEKNSKKPQMKSRWEAQLANARTVWQDGNRSINRKSFKM